MEREELIGRLQVALAARAMQQAQEALQPLVDAALAVVADVLAKAEVLVTEVRRWALKALLVVAQATAAWVHAICEVMRRQRQAQMIQAWLLYQEAGKPWGPGESAMLAWLRWKASSASTN